MLYMPDKYIALCDALTGGVQIYEHIEHYQSDYNLNVGHLETGLLNAGNILLCG